MKSFTMCFPILPGKMETWKAFNQELGHARKVEFDAMMKRCGVSRSRTWLQPMPQGEACFSLHEGSSPDRMISQLVKANDQFGQWFKDKMRECHGVDLDGPQSVSKFVVQMGMDCSH
jgi:hypothetical protein